MYYFENIYSGFAKNCEANISELLENLDYMVLLVDMVINKYYPHAKS